MKKQDVRNDIIAELNATYFKKNHDYGDSFAESYDEFGPIAAIIRMDDKMRRLKNLIAGDTPLVNSESIRDTLIDLANYAIMLVTEMDSSPDDDEDDSDSMRTSYIPLNHNTYKNLPAIVQNFIDSLSSFSRLTIRIFEDRDDSTGYLGLRLYTSEANDPVACMMHTFVEDATGTWIFKKATSMAVPQFLQSL